MSGKSGLAIGVLVGLILGLIGVSVVVWHTTGRRQAAQASAFEEGRLRGIEMAASGAVEIGGQLNQGMAADNQRMADLIDGARRRLEALHASEDLPPTAKDELATVIAALAE